MRSLWFTGTIAALLAGCASGESGQTARAKSADAPGSHGTHSATSTVQYPHDHSETIPAAFHGVYDKSLQACRRPGVERLTVSARELRFHESVGSVRSVAYGGGFGAIAVEADYEGEGESRRGLRILTLSENGSKLTVKGEGTSFERVRCPAGSL